MSADPGPAPSFLGDPVTDALAHVVFELTAELWVVKRRLELLEGELTARGGTPLDAVPISDEEAQQSARAAKEFVTSVLGALERV